jgi:hypothetical protein
MPVDDERVAAATGAGDAQLNVHASDALNGDVRLGHDSSRNNV